MKQDAIHEYMRRILRAVERGFIDPGSLGNVNVIHDDDCGALKGGRCRCECDVEVICVDSNGRARSFAIGTDGELISPVSTGAN